MEVMRLTEIYGNKYININNKKIKCVVNSKETGHYELFSSNQQKGEYSH